jgi:hypothetical protein
MKLQSCLIWVLGALLALAAADTIPDPPALNPHVVTVAARLSAAHGEVADRLLRSDLTSFSPLQVSWVAFTSAHEPNIPSDWTALTTFATDPSPPASEIQRT